MTDKHKAEPAKNIGQWSATCVCGRWLTMVSPSWDGKRKGGWRHAPVRPEPSWP